MRMSLKDADWVRQSFLMPQNSIDEAYDAVRRVYTTADQKFTDTTLGGNFAINAFPQFTRNADIKRPGRYTAGKGMGRFYSEVIDDNAQTIHIRLGVPKFNSLTRFFGDFYNVEASSLARTGRTPSIFYDVGRLTGTVVSLPLQPILLTAKLIRLLLEKPASRYYYLKPTMPLYWNAVATMVNGIAVNLGVIPRLFTSDAKTGNSGLIDPDSVNDAEEQKAAIAATHKLLPDIYRSDGGIDIYAVANRAQRLANAFRDALEQEVVSSANATDLTNRMKRMTQWNPTVQDVGKGDLREYMRLYLESNDGIYTVKDEDKEVTESSMEVDVRDESFVNSMSSFFTAERRMGSDFVTFRVDHTGPQSESFSTSTKESGIASTINSMSSKARSTRFDLADGNVDSAGLIGAVVKAATDTVNGIAEGLSIHGIAALAGSAFADIPKTWDASTADVGRSSFTIPLRSPYGNDLSRLQNIIVPMCMLLAMALPLSTGKQSYTSPFILELFNKGRTQIRLGMVESLSITRGVGDVGWTNDGRYLGVDVNITFMDLSEVVHMPINASFSTVQAAIAGAGSGLGAAISKFTGGDSTTGANIGAGIASAFMPSTYDDDNKYTDYLAVLGSLPLEAQVNPMRKMRLRLTQQMAAFNQWKSPAHFANWAMGTWAGELLKAVSQRTDRP